MTTTDRQPREHTVPCTFCARPTWEVTAVCDRCDRARTGGPDTRAAQSNAYFGWAKVFRDNS